MAGGLTPDPAQSVWVGYPHFDIPGFYPSKLGLQADMLYGLQRMATGAYPSITTDTLCAYYSRQTGAALASPTADPRGGISAEDSDQTQTGANPASLVDYVYVTCYLAQSGFIRLVNAPVVPAQTHTNLVSWVGDSFGVYDPVTPFTGTEVGQTLQVVQGDGWTTGNYTVDRIITQATQDGAQTILHLTASPGSGSIRLGQASVYAAGAALPTLPPPVNVAVKFAPAGQSFVRLPVRAGMVKVTLERSSAVVLSMTGENVVNTAAVANPQNFTMTTGN